MFTQQISYTKKLLMQRKLYISEDQCSENVLAKIVITTSFETLNYQLHSIVCIYVIKTINYCYNYQLPQFYK